jgi:predicted PilT family ATPase
MFAEAFGLKAVYVPLRAYWERNATGDEPSRALAKVRVVVDLHDELDASLDNDQRDELLRVISGGPGSGKSSFARMYAAATMTRGRVRIRRAAGSPR